MARLLRRIDSLSSRRASEYGGKAQGLVALSRAGFPVPPAFALPAHASRDFFAAHLTEDEHPSALLKSGDFGPERLRGLFERMSRAPLPSAVSRGVREAVRALQSEGAVAVAVRSSSTGEDSGEASAAGVHETELNVRSEAGAEDAVRRAFAGVFQPKVFAYLRKMDVDPDAAIGVVIQAMVDADVAGVLFTVNPLTGDAGELVIDAAYGLGSVVVSGRVSPDTLRIDKATGGPRDRVIGDKQIRCVLGEDGGVREEPTPEELRGKLALSESQVGELTALGLRIESSFAEPRDVEWAFHAGKLVVLQARPVTAAILPSTRRWQKRRSDARDRARIVWSNVNVGEALPGVATPLTWSILSGFSELGFRRAFGSLGCTVPRDAELVGCFRGRIYLNMSEFMSILSQVPGLRPRRLLALGGGGEIERLEEDIESRSPVAFLARLPVTAARFARENLSLDERVREFEAGFEVERRRISGVDPRILPDAGLARMIGDVERVLDQSGAIMLTAYGNLLGTAVLLSAGLRLFARDRAESLQRDLLSGIANLDSAAPGLALWHIAEMASEDPEARDLILAGEASTLRLQSLPDGPIRRALTRFLRAYGHRGAREAEIAEPRWREDPTILFATLQIHMRHEEGERPLDHEQRQRAIREAAERELDRLVPVLGRPAFRHLLTLVRRFMRLRERLRGIVTEVLGGYRLVALDASRRIAAREPDAGTDAAFFLTESELRDVLRTSTRVATRVTQRRRQFERDRALPDPPDTFVGFPPPIAPAVESPMGGALRGLGASSGVVTGRARVLDDPAQASLFQRGEILVSACADVGWSPLFLVAAGVVTDLGGPLSHASIVLREYGIPAVVNVKSGTRVIRTGDLLRVDGDRGVVHVLQDST